MNPIIVFVVDKNELSLQLLNTAKQFNNRPSYVWDYGHKLSTADIEMLKQDDSFIYVRELPKTIISAQDIVFCSNEIIDIHDFLEWSLNYDFGSTANRIYDFFVPLTARHFLQYNLSEQQISKVLKDIPEMEFIVSPYYEKVLYVKAEFFSSLPESEKFMDFHSLIRYTIALGMKYKLISGSYIGYSIDVLDAREFRCTENRLLNNFCELINLKCILRKNGKKNILYLIHADFHPDAINNIGGTQYHLRDLVLNL